MNVCLCSNRALDGVPAFLRQVFEQASEQTGWAFTVLAGGPCPEEGGAIKTMSYVFCILYITICSEIASRFHVGQTPAGNTFKMTHPKWQEHVALPFRSFLKLVYRAFAIPYVLNISNATP